MRPAGFTLAALLLGVAVVSGQTPPPGTPVPPVPGGAPKAAPPGIPPGAPPVAPALPPAAPAAADPKLEAHLLGWEKTMGALANFRVELSLKRTDSVFKQDKTFTGVVLCMKPLLSVVRLNYDGDKTGNDYEAFICDGKAVYEYNGLAKTITRWKLPDPKANPGGGTDNLMLDFLTGLKAKDAKARFDISLFKEDDNYVYLDVKPILGKDKAEFQQLRMALYGPKTKWAYLPAQVFMVKKNDDSELWKFTNPQTNIPGVEEKMFQFTPVKGFDMKEGLPPAPPAAGRPGQPMLPAGSGLPAGNGAVRPGPTTPGLPPKMP